MLVLPLAFLDDPGLRLAFVIALHGCALLILGSLSLVVRWPEAADPADAEPRWGWLGVFGLAKGASVVAPVVLGAMNHSIANDVLRGVYLFFAVAAYGALLGFGRAGVPVGWPRRAADGVAAATLAAAVAGALAWPAARWPEGIAVLAVPAGGLAAVRLLDFALGEWTGGRFRRIGAAGVGLGAFALAALAALELGGTAYLDRFQGWTIHTLPDFEDFRLGAMLAGAVAAWAAVFGWWMWARARVARGSAVAAGVSQALVLLPVGFVALVAAGFGFLRWLNDDGEQRTSDHYRARARALALALDADAVDRLAAGDGTVRAQLAQRLRQLRAASPDAQAIMLWTVRDGRVTTLVADEPAFTVPELPGRWQDGGAPDPRFFGPGREFVSETLRDAQGQYQLGNAPVRWDDGRPSSGWLAVRIAQATWDEAKGPVMAQATVIILLVAIVGIAVLVYFIQRDMERDLRLWRTRAEAESRAKSEFLAFMSHELRTPLQSVLGYTELMRSEPHPAAQEVPLAAVQSQGRLLLRMISDLLDFSAAEAGQIRLAPAPFALRPLVDDCIAAIRPLAREKGLGLSGSVELATADGFLGDAQRLKQVLLNLLGNAVKFTARGQVDLQAVVTPPAAAADTAGWECRFAVSDTGPGIPAAERSRLFRPFARLDQPEGATAPGAGLGLALVRRICELMGGSVECASEPGRGTTFTVRLMLPAAPVPAAEPAATAPAKLGPVRVLVVEDNPLTRDLLVLFLRALGCEPTAVATGDDAVGAFVSEAFPVVLMDLRLPGRLDGLAAARAIRAQAPSPEWPWIVACSASLLTAEREQCRAAGMQGFLAKPVTRAELAAALAVCPWVGTAAADDAARAAAAGARPVRSPFDDVRLNLDAAVAAKMVEQFRHENPHCLARLRAAGEAAAWREAEAAAHYLKNTALLFGDDALADACARCEAAARAGGPIAAEAAEIERAAAKLGAALAV